jgi:hypothetical protein
MAFSQWNISGVDVQSDGVELFVNWASPAPQGTTFQVYLDRRLAWNGTSRRCHLPIPAGASGRNVWVYVVSVDPGEATHDYSANLAATSGGCELVQLSWLDGTYLDPSGQGDVRGFRIYRGPAPGAPPTRTTPVGTVAAYPGGWVSDGFGLGGFGLGGFGFASTTYDWVTLIPPAGAWQYAVVPYDSAGNDRGQGQTITVSSSSAPRPPAQSSTGSRLSYSYSGPATRLVTLTWLPSPSLSDTGTK